MDHASIVAAAPQFAGVCARADRRIAHKRGPGGAARRPAHLLDRVAAVPNGSSSSGSGRKHDYSWSPTQRPPVPGSARRALPLRAYFAGLFVVGVLAAIAGAFYVDRGVERDARATATRSAIHSAETTGEQLGDHVALLKATAANLAANPQIATILTRPAGCTLTFQGLGGPDRGHLDIIRANGTVACSSRELTPAATRTGYAGSSWLSAALAKPQFLAPARDALGGASVAIASAPIPGGKGTVVAFADLGALARTSPSNTAAAARRSS